MTNTGCPAPLKCGSTRIAGDGGDSFEVGCVPEGFGAAGLPCSFSVDAGAGRFSDTCGARLACGFAEGCRPICNPASPSCVDSQCVLLEALPRAFGVCVPTCNGVTQRLDGTGQDCGSGRACYGFAGGAAASFCFSTQMPAVGHGAPTTVLNGCAPGTAATRVDGGTACVALCRPVEIHRGRTADAGGLSPFSCAERGAPGVECHHYWELEDLRALTPPAQPTVRSNTWGFCADPALFPNVASCASLDAGAHLDAGCAPR